MSFIVVTVSDWLCCNIDYHKSNTLDRNKQYISKNKVWSGTIFWKPFAVVRRQFPFPDCFLFRTVRLQRPGISLWLIARPKNHLLHFLTPAGTPSFLVYTRDLLRYTKGNAYHRSKHLCDQDLLPPSMLKRPSFQAPISRTDSVHARMG